MRHSILKNLVACPSCLARPGQRHSGSCDVERCSVCGGQKLGCDCDGHDKDFAKWTGIWPGQMEADYLKISLNQLYSDGYAKIFFVKKPLYGSEMIKPKFCKECGAEILVHYTTTEQVYAITEDGKFERSDNNDVFSPGGIEFKCSEVLEHDIGEDKLSQWMETVELELHDCGILLE